MSNRGADLVVVAWNRLFGLLLSASRQTSGAIPKKGGGERLLGIL